MPSVNIYGAAISSIACHMVAFTICLFALNQSVRITGSAMKYLAKPLIANGVMGAFSIAAYQVAHRLAHSNALATLSAIVLSVAVYVFAVAALRILSPEEVEQLPRRKALRFCVG
jgi:peptidoglycan biosynthesis protein MviN/MurJ (putative lipid II flippase)